MNTNKTNERSGNNFDFLRLLAAVFVVYDHSIGLGGYKTPDWALSLTNGKFTISYLGVTIFFVISGYLISKSFIRSGNPIDFVWKRILRLYPGIFALTLVTAFLFGPVNTRLSLFEYFQNPRFISYFSSASIIFTQQDLPGCFELNPFPVSINGSLWTLIFEMTMYLTIFICGLLYSFTKNKLTFLISVIYTSYLFIFQDDSLIPKHKLWNYMDINSYINFGKFFMAGSLLYVLEKWIKYTKYIFAMMLAILIFSFYHDSIFNYTKAFTVSYIVLYFCFIKSKVATIGRHGDFSYGMYIYAFPVQQTLAHFLQGQIPFPVFFLASLIGTFGFAYLSWFLVESPSLKFKDLFSKLFEPKSNLQAPN